jgi:hypothetical protein
MYRLNVPMGSPTDKMMSPCTKQLQSKKFFKAEKRFDLIVFILPSVHCRLSLRPKLLADSFRNAIEKQQQQLQQKQQQQSETSFD